MANITTRYTKQGLFHRYGIGVFGVAGWLAEVEALTSEAGLAEFIAEEASNGVERDPASLRIAEIGYDHTVHTLTLRFNAPTGGMEDIEKTVSYVFATFGVAVLDRKGFSIDVTFYSYNSAVRALGALRASETEAGEFLQSAKIDGKAV